MAVRYCTIHRWDFFAERWLAFGDPSSLRLGLIAAL